MSVSRRADTQACTTVASPLQSTTLQMRLRSLITALTTLALTTGVSRHASADEPSDNRAELTARAEFLEDRLATQRSHATWWWGGWLGFYTAGAIFQTYRTVEATDTSTKGAQGVSAVKAVFGITRLALQPFGGYGELAGNPNLDGLSTPELRARVDEGERVLVENVDKQSSSKAWYAHVGNVGINLLGAVIVATAFDDPAQGFIDAGIGVACLLYTSPSPRDS